MDILNDILDTLALRGVLYFRTDFSAPWAIQVPDHEQAARFHLVMQGQCHVVFDSERTADLGHGDLILIPRGRSHVLADRPGRNAAPLDEVLVKAGYDGQGVLVVGDGDPDASTQMVCGHFSFRPGADHPLLQAMPDYFVTSADLRSQQPWLNEVLGLVAQRMLSGQIGSQASATRLSEIVFIELLRLGVMQDPSLQALLEAFTDHQIGRALSLIHADPAAAWTVEGLAQQVGMSRSRFAERFSALIGTAPMSYLANWRLQKALALLDDEKVSIQQIAAQSGYQSPAAFTRAFAGKFGRPPREHRREQH
ncbi:MAG: AraC family transcriptional regulator [Kiloniellales bacterium]